MIPRPISIAFRPPSITASHSAQGAAWRELEACALPDHHGYSGAVPTRLAAVSGRALWGFNRSDIWRVGEACGQHPPIPAAHLQRRHHRARERPGLVADYQVLGLLQSGRCRYVDAFPSCV
ncbi:hypothetical protein FIBSPDRAFT_295130 [Athelia psychrophila]|uniref:Uncharacterized protein n=1 Tax=Athelia psychrophila TaxID=1759441 RepID=A0A167XDY9_9AGAM|nr:hypothetical protein FIBSPDRAFT_295130 [Fibularhizoctonia sp. CBS 109695]